MCLVVVAAVRSNHVTSTRLLSLDLFHCYKKYLAFTALALYCSKLEGICTVEYA